MTTLCRCVLPLGMVPVWAMCEEDVDGVLPDGRIIFELFTRETYEVKGNGTCSFDVGP